MTIKEHVERILKEKNVKKNELAEKLGVTPPTITSYLSDNVSISTLRKMASALGVPLGELTGDPATFKKKDEYVYIPILDVALSAGPGIENHYPSAIEKQFVMERVEFHLNFPGVNPENVKGVKVRGDSMVPTFMDKDIVFVDISDKELRDSIFALTLEGTQLIKRIQHFPGNRIMVVSDNHKYTPIPINEYSQVQIEGHVIGAVMVRRV